MNYTGKRPIYQLWDEAGFTMDTLFLDWQSQMMYRTLLQKAWYVSTRPDLPADDDSLARLLGCPIEVWCRYSDTIRPLFTVETVNGNSVLRQKRLFADWSLIETARTKKSDAANKRWEKESAAVQDKSEAKQREDEEKRSKEECIADAVHLHTDASSPAPLPSVGLAGESAPDAAPTSGRLAAPTSGIPLPHAFKASQAKQPNPDVQKIQAASFELGWKLPAVRDIEAVLAVAALDNILDAMKEYNGTLGENTADSQFAERRFFVEGGGLSIMTAIENRKVRV